MTAAREGGAGREGSAAWEGQPPQGRPHPGPWALKCAVQLLSVVHSHLCELQGWGGVRQGEGWRPHVQSGGLCASV